MPAFLMVRRALLTACGLPIAIHVAAAQTVVFTPGYVEPFSMTAGSTAAPLPQAFTVAPVGAEKLRFRFVGATGVSDVFVVSPSSGVAPTRIYVGLNMNVVPYLAPGGYAASLRFAVEGQSSEAGTPGLRLGVYALPPPQVASVVSAASLQPAISPGQIVSIFGANLGTPPLPAQYGAAGIYPTTLGNSTVAFNGIDAPLLYVSPGQINAVVPYGVAGQKTVEVVVTHNLRKSAPFSVPLLDTSPGIFTVGQGGNGPGAILNNVIGAPWWVPLVNSADNPAAKGSAISIFATGAGLLKQAVPDGSILLAADPAFYPAAPVSLTIGGSPATVLYAGPAPYQVSGVLQVNALVPKDIGSGPQPVVLTIGNNSNSPQQVTVAVQ